MSSTSPEQSSPKGFRERFGALPVWLRFVLAILLIAGNVFLWREVQRGYFRTSESPGSVLAQVFAPGRPNSPDHILGFRVDNASIPREEILRGGPPKDGIPAILTPKFVSAERADFLEPEELVIGVVGEKKQRAYPLRILVWHEVVNDTLDGTPLAVTYCPLCGTSMVFDRRSAGEERSFGVSGLLYNSDVLMYDHQTESLWSQLKMASVAGELVGTELTWLPSEQMTWAAWQAKYPETEVLSEDTGYNRSYGANSYALYERSKDVMFPTPYTRKELEQKSWVVGVLVDGMAKAYAVKSLETLGAEGELRDEVNGKTILVTYDAESRHANFVNADGERIPSVNVYWFAWQSFYPDTALWMKEGTEDTGTEDMGSLSKNE